MFNRNNAPSNTPCLPSIAGLFAAPTTNNTADADMLVARQAYSNTLHNQFNAAYQQNNQEMLAQIQRGFDQCNKDAINHYQNDPAILQEYQKTISEHQEAVLNYFKQENVNLNVAPQNFNPYITFITMQNINRLHSYCQLMLISCQSLIQLIDGYLQKAELSTSTSITPTFTAPTFTVPTAPSNKRPSGTLFSPQARPTPQDEKNYTPQSKKRKITPETQIRTPDVILIEDNERTVIDLASGMGSGKRF